ncbi:hypothetical protein V8C37DRAFT_394612 [Trichoderma ceciliae]
MCGSQCKSKEEHTENIQFRKSFLNNRATWNNQNGQAQSVDGLCLDIDINIDALNNKAMFKLHCSVYLKFRNNWKHSIYLFIYPEYIRSIVFEDDEKGPSLIFSLNQYPDLIIPPGDKPLVAKPNSDHLLSSMQALALIKDFTIRFGDSEMDHMHRRLQLVASIFSSSSSVNRPVRDEYSADLKSLYVGTGGVIANVSSAAAIDPNETGLPPPYEQPRSHKRKRNDSPIAGDVASSTEHRLTKIECITREMKADIETMKKQFERLQDTIVRRFERIEDIIVGECTELHNQWGEIVELEVGKHMNNNMESLKTELDCKFHDKDKEIDKSMEYLIDNAMDVIKKGLEGQLPTFAEKLTGILLKKMNEKVEKEQVEKELLNVTISINKG